MEPPRKRPRLSHPTARSIVSHEIDLEIALRQRLEQTIESRIAWASSLHQALVGGKKAAVTTPSASQPFRDVALDAFQAIEEPCHVLFDMLDDDDDSFVPPPPGQAIAPPKRKQLFIRYPASTPTHPHHIFKLLCPACSRSNFVSLQGLLNHARIAHATHYGNHDECIEACAVLVADGDEEAGGTEVVLGEGGVCGVPSLQKLFARAVGLHARDLVRTLGHHRDTPAIAPFLGIAPVRCIKAVDEDAEVDVVACAPLGAPRWRKPCVRGSRSRAMAGDGVSVDWEPGRAQTVPSDVQHSRFHILARLVVAHQTLWIPTQHRGVGGDTHQWALTITSSSYTAMHHTRFISRVTLLRPHAPPWVLTGPPFQFVSTASQPFLAKLRLEWVGPEHAGVEVDHWVSLDRSKSVSPIRGEEQIIDVELDRNLPFKDPHTSTSEEIRWGFRYKPSPKGATLASATADGTEYEKGLRSLLPSFPLTQKDVKNKRSLLALVVNALPYKLVANPTVLASLVMGRRKAIEWGRARAIRDAYMRGEANGGCIVRLTTSDVYCWMSEQGLFARPKTEAPTIKSEATGTEGDAWCPCCGHHMAAHPDRFLPSRSNLAVCAFGVARLTTLPVLRVPAVFRTIPSPLAPACSASRFPPSALVTAADPGLIIAVRDVVRGLGLACVDAPPLGLERPADMPALSKTEVDAHLAPYALLAIAAGCFLRMMVRGGLSVNGEAGRWNGVESGKRQRMLVPSNVLHWLHRTGLVQRVVGRVEVEE